MKLTHTNEKESWRLSRLVDFVSALKSTRASDDLIASIKKLKDDKGTLIVTFNDDIDDIGRMIYFDYMSEVWEIMLNETDLALLE